MSELHSRLIPDDRKKQLLEAATDVAIKVGYANITRKAVAERVGVTRGLVSHYFGSMQQLRRTLMRNAIAKENLQIIAQGLIARDPLALKANEDLRIKSLQALF